MYASWQIEIPRRSKRCSLNQEQFAEGTEYYSLLQRDEDKGHYVRKDFCNVCWEQVSKDYEKGSCSLWKSKVPLRSFEKKSESRDIRALDILRESIQDLNENILAEAFVLALYLARKRIIVQREEVYIEEKKMLLFEIIATEEMLLIPKIELSQIQTDNVQLELVKKLSI